MWLVGAALAGAPVLGDPEAISVQPGLLLQTRLTVDGQADWTPALGMQRVRPVLRGTVDGHKVTYSLQTELAGTVALLDAQVDVRPVEGLTISAGRFLVPFSRAQLTPVPKLQYHGFSTSTTAMQHGRDVGVQVGIAPAEARVQGQLGVFEGTGSLEAVRPLVVGHLDVALIGRTSYDETAAVTDPDGPPSWAVGAGAIAGVQHRPGDDADLEAETLGLDSAWRAGPVRMQGEAFWRRWKDGLVDLGGTTQVSVRIGRIVELGSRGDLLQVDGAHTWTAEGLANVYGKGDHLRVGALVTVRSTPDGASEAFALQQQLWF